MNFIDPYIEGTIEYTKDSRFAKGRRHIAQKAISSTATNANVPMSSTGAILLGIEGFRQGNSLLHYAAAAGIAGLSLGMDQLINRRKEQPETIDKEATKLLEVLPALKIPDGQTLKDFLASEATLLMKACVDSSGDKLAEALGGLSQEIPIKTYRRAGIDISEILVYLPPGSSWNRSAHVTGALKMSRLTQAIVNEFKSLSQDGTVNEGLSSIYAAQIEVLDKRLPLSEDSGFSSWGEYAASAVSQEATAKYIEDSASHLR